MSGIPGTVGSGTRSLRQELASLLRSRRDFHVWPSEGTLDAVRDADIDTSEIPPLDKSFFDNVELRLPDKKKSVTVRLDADFLEWFRSQGKGYQTRINAVLGL